MTALDLFGKERCPICKKRLYFWQQADWEPLIGKNIHFKCGEEYDGMTTKEKLELKETKSE